MSFLTHGYKTDLVDAGGEATEEVVESLGLRPPEGPGRCLEAVLGDVVDQLDAVGGGRHQGRAQADQQHQLPPPPASHHAALSPGHAQVRDTPTFWFSPL